MVERSCLHAAAAAAAAAAAFAFEPLILTLICSEGGSSKVHDVAPIAEVMLCRSITRPIASINFCCSAGSKVSMSVTRVTTTPGLPASPGATVGANGVWRIQQPGATAAAPIPTCSVKASGCTELIVRAMVRDRVVGKVTLGRGLS